MLSGGGTSGIAYAGVMEVLLDHGLVDYCTKPLNSRVTRNFYGCSVGAFFALIMYLGIDLRDPVWRNHLRQFVSLFKPSSSEFPLQKSRIGTLSLCGTGKSVRNFIDGVIYGALGVRNATFKQLHDIVRDGGVFKVFTTSLERGPLELSAATHPYTLVKNGIFASLLIPLLFSPITIRRPRFDLIHTQPHTKLQVDVDHCIDGAIGGNNYPIDAPSDTERVLGVRFTSNFDGQKSAASMDFVAFVSRIISLTIQRPQPHRPTHFEVVIESGGNDPVNFDVDKQREEDLVSRGKEAARTAIGSQNFF